MPIAYILKLRTSQHPISIDSGIHGLHHGRDYIGLPELFLHSIQGIFQVEAEGHQPAARRHTGGGLVQVK